MMCCAYVGHRTDTCCQQAQCADMKLLASTRTKRSTACAMLLVGLFALASGVANACLLEKPESHAGAVQRSAAMASHGPAGLVAHSGTTASHHDDSDSTKESCLKACDDGSHTLLNVYSAFDHTDPGPAALFAILWTGSPGVVLATHRPDDRAPPMVGPPFRIR